VEAEGVPGQGGEKLVVSHEGVGKSGRRSKTTRIDGVEKTGRLVGLARKEMIVVIGEITIQGIHISVVQIRKLRVSSEIRHVVRVH